MRRACLPPPFVLAAPSSRFPPRGFLACSSIHIPTRRPCATTSMGGECVCGRAAVLPLARSSLIRVCMLRCGHGIRCHELLPPVWRGSDRALLARVSSVLWGLATGLFFPLRVCLSAYRDVLFPRRQDVLAREIHAVTHVGFCLSWYVDTRHRRFKYNTRDVSRLSRSPRTPVSWASFPSARPTPQATARTACILAPRGHPQRLRPRVHTT